MDKEENKPLVPKIPTLKDSKTPTVKIKGLAAGPMSLIQRLKQFKQKDLAFISAGLGVLFMAPLAEHFMMAPENGSSGSSFKEGWGFRDGAGALGRGASPYEGGVNGLAPGGYLGGGADVITPLNVRDPSALVMGPNQTAPVPVSAPQAPAAKPEPSWKDALASSASRGAKEAIKAASPVPKIPLQGGLRGLGAVSGGGGGGGYSLPPISAGNVPNTASASRALTRVTPATGYKGTAGARGPDNMSTGAFENLKKAAAGAAGEMNRGGSAAGNLDSASAASNFPSGQQGDGGASGGTGAADKAASQNQGAGSKSGGGESLAFQMKKKEMEKRLDLDWKKKEKEEMFGLELKQDSLKTLLADGLVKPFAKLASDRLEALWSKPDAVSKWTCYDRPADKVGRVYMGVKSALIADSCGSAKKDEAGKSLCWCPVGGSPATGGLICKNPGLEPYAYDCTGGPAPTTKPGEGNPNPGGGAGAETGTSVSEQQSGQTKGGVETPILVGITDVSKFGTELCAPLKRRTNLTQNPDAKDGSSVALSKEQIDNKSAIESAAKAYLKAAQQTAIAAAALTGGKVPVECLDGDNTAIVFAQGDENLARALQISETKLTNAMQALAGDDSGALIITGKVLEGASMVQTAMDKDIAARFADAKEGMVAKAPVIDGAVRKARGADQSLSSKGGIPAESEVAGANCDEEPDHSRPYVAKCLYYPAKKEFEAARAAWKKSQAVALSAAQRGAGDGQVYLPQLQSAKASLVGKVDGPLGEAKAVLGRIGGDKGYLSLTNQALIAAESGLKEGQAVKTWKPNDEKKNKNKALLDGFGKSVEGVLKELGTLKADGSGKGKILHESYQRQNVALNGGDAIVGASQEAAQAKALQAKVNNFVAQADGYRQKIQGNEALGKVLDVVNNPIDGTANDPTKHGSGVRLKAVEDTAQMQGNYLGLQKPRALEMKEANEQFAVLKAAALKTKERLLNKAP